MFIIPLPGNRRDFEVVYETNDVFDLLMDDHAQPHYLIIQDNSISLVGMGNVSGKVALHIKSRTSNINGDTNNPQMHGNVGFLGTFSSLEDAVTKLYSRKGCGVSNMKYVTYSGQTLRTNRDHYVLIEPILCLMRSNPTVELKSFFQNLGWGGRTRFDCSGAWGRDMKLYIGGKLAASLEVWFANYCYIALK